MDPDLLAYLLSVAIQLSGLPPIGPDELPPIERLPPDQLNRQVCPGDPGNCIGLAAYFDIPAYRILIDRRLDPLHPADHSYLLHEFVHVLQYRVHGPTLFARCEDSFRHEAQAYRVQNIYLRRQGVLLRVGDALQLARCAREERLDRP